MNVRKPVDYGTMYRELAAILARNLPQMDEIYAIGKVISQRPEKGAAVAAAEFLQANFPDRTGFSPRNVRRMRDFYKTYEKGTSPSGSDVTLLWKTDTAGYEQLCQMDPAGTSDRWSGWRCQQFICRVSELGDTVSGR